MTTTKFTHPLPTYVDRPAPFFGGVRGRILALLCVADDRMSGGQIAAAVQASRSTNHQVLAELVAVGIVTRHEHPSVTMFELRDNAVGRAVDTLHDPEATHDDRQAAAGILHHVLPTWAAARHELKRLSVRRGAMIPA